MKRMDALRQFVFDAPDEESWLELVLLLDDWPQGPELDIALEYAQHHTARWPEDLIDMPEEWLHSLHNPRQPVHPGLAMARYLFLEHTQLHPINGAIKRLAQTQRACCLQKLYITEAQHTDPKDLAALLRAPHLSGLKTLQIKGAPRRGTRAVLEAFADAPFKLDHLEWSDAGLDASALRLLLGAPCLSKLKLLDLSYNNLKATGAQRLLELAPASLESLWVTHNHITGPGAGALAQFFEERSPNAWGYIHNNPLGDEVTARLVASGMFSAMELLELNNTGAGALTLQALSEATFEDDLEVCLELPGNTLPLRPLAPALRHLSPHLVSLNLSGTGIGDVGAQHVASSKPTHLRVLNMSHCGLTSAGVRELCKYRYYRVNGLELRDNPIDDAGARTLATAVAFPNLEWLDISDTNLSPDGVQRLKSAQQRLWKDMNWLST